MMSAGCMEDTPEYKAMMAEQKARDKAAADPSDFR